MSEKTKGMEETVVESYKKMEDAVVGGYKKVEDTVVAGYRKIEDTFIDKFLAHDGESTEEARARITGKPLPTEEQK